MSSPVTRLSTENHSVRRRSERRVPRRIPPTSLTDTGSLLFAAHASERRQNFSPTVIGLAVALGDRQVWGSTTLIYEGRPAGRQSALSHDWRNPLSLRQCQTRWHGLFLGLAQAR